MLTAFLVTFGAVTTGATAFLWRSRAHERVIAAAADRDAVAQLNAQQRALDQATEQGERQRALLQRTAHAVRATAHGVLAAATTLTETPGDPHAAAPQVLALREGCSALTALADDLVDFTDAATPPPPAPGPTSPSDLIARLRDRFAPTAAKLGTTLTFDVDEHLPAVVLLDRPRVWAALCCLTDHAVRQAAGGAAQVSVRADTAPERAQSLTFEVHDTGRDAPKAAASHPFEPLHRVQALPPHPAHGTRLGLATAARQVAACGGQIETHHDAELGIYVWFSVPAPAVVLPAHSPTGRVLLIEPERPQQTATRLLLEALAYTAHVVADDAQAVAALANTPYVAVLRADPLPGHDDLDGLLNAANHGSPIPVIAVSTFANHVHRAKSLTAGLADHLSKPLRKSLLAVVLQYHTRPNTGDEPR